MGYFRELPEIAYQSPFLILSISIDQHYFNNRQTGINQQQSTKNDRIKDKQTK